MNEVELRERLAYHRSAVPGRLLWRPENADLLEQEFLNCTRVPTQSFVSEFLAGEIRLKGFDSVEIGTMPTWTEDPFEDRNWQWRWHQWEFIIWLVRVDEANRRNVRNQLLDWTRKWWVDNRDGPSSDLSWHDHSTAFRLRNLILFRHWLEMDSVIHYDLAWMDEAIFVHARLLAEEEFYSKRTNHGFDQMHVLLFAGLVLYVEDSEVDWCRHGTERLEDEIGFGFSTEGVHVENSPGYHLLMINRILQIRPLLERGGVEGVEARTMMLLEGAFEHLCWVIQPNGLLPRIGDTGDIQVDLEAIRLRIWGINRIEESPQGERLLSESGWGIIRRKLTSNPLEDFHLILKCGFLSSYHRHDDDCHLSLFAYGSEWLVDSGLFNHQEEDQHRIHVRSARAHNIPFIHDTKVSRRLSDGEMTSLVTEGEEWVASSQMFEGCQIERRFQFLSPDGFRVHDTAKRADGKPVGDLEVRWHLHPNLKVERDELGVRAEREDGRVMFIRTASTDVDINISAGEQDGRIESWISSAYSTGEDATVVRISPQNESALTVEIGWE